MNRFNEALEVRLPRGHEIRASLFNCLAILKDYACEVDFFREMIQEGDQGAIDELREYEIRMRRELNRELYVIEEGMDIDIDHSTCYLMLTNNSNEVIL